MSAAALARYVALLHTCCELLLLLSAEGEPLTAREQRVKDRLAVAVGDHD